MPKCRCRRNRGWHSHYSGTTKIELLILEWVWFKWVHYQREREQKLWRPLGRTFGTSSSSSRNKCHHSGTKWTLATDLAPRCTIATHHLSGEEQFIPLGQAHCEHTPPSLSLSSHEWPFLKHTLSSLFFLVSPILFEKNFGPEVLSDKISVLLSYF